MKLRSSLVLAVALLAGAAQAQEVNISSGGGPGCTSCASGGSGAEAWLVPRPGPQGFSHPATSVYAEKCCRDHYPGCCDNVWDGYCSERYCWHSDKACRYGAAGCAGYGYGAYAGQRWGSPRGWSGGGWGWNPYGGAATMLGQPVSVPSGGATWSGSPTAAPENAAPGATPSATFGSPSAEAPVATPVSTGESPSARNWSGYPRNARTW